jgi:hypothetical protein
VIGAYHANVIYTGPGMVDYHARRLDFLWVRWYEVVDPASSGWSRSRLDVVKFPPMREDDSFGFIDPKDVLRACHILPAFRLAIGKDKDEDGDGEKYQEKRHPNGVGISRCAKDGKDYKKYFVGR